MIASRYKFHIVNVRIIPNLMTETHENTSTILNANVRLDKNIHSYYSNGV
jgi:hypothetical protein